MDKASVLGEAIKYLKQMQEKVSALEEEQNRKRTVESVVIVKKSRLSSDAEDSSSSETGDTFDEALPEIEARFWERNVLIRIHCEKNKGVIEKTISEIEKLHLKVINSSALTFGSFILDITIIAQVNSALILLAETFHTNQVQSIYLCIYIELSSNIAIITPKVVQIIKKNKYSRVIQKAQLVRIMSCCFSSFCSI